MLIHYDGTSIEMNDLYSFKNNYNCNTSNIHNDINIYQSCFSQEIPDTKIFPNNMQGITFYNCNLDNVYIPTGNKAVGSSCRRYKTQSDGRDWEIDESNNPIKCMDNNISVLNIRN